MPAGRPFKFNLEEGLKKIFAHINERDKEGNIKKGNMQHVKTNVHCCAFLSISKDTWYAHVKRHKKHKLISDSIKKLKSLQEVWWIDAGLSGKVNSTAWVFCQKNIAGWRDKVDIDNTIHDTTADNKKVLEMSKVLANFLGIGEDEEE